MINFVFMIIYTNEICSLNNSSIDSCVEMTVFWNVVPCSVIEIDLCFGGAYYFHHQENEISQLCVGS
jgi:hypothetical protein